jgi:hypothetical protein
MRVTLSRALSPGLLALLSLVLASAGCATEGGADGTDTTAGKSDTAEATDTASVADPGSEADAPGSATDAGGCTSEIAEAKVADVRQGCKAIFDEFPDGIPGEPVKILGAVPIKDLCDCVVVMKEVLAVCTFEELEAGGLTGIPTALVDNLGLAGSVCGSSDERCPTGDDFETDDVDPVRDYFDGYEGYATVPTSTLEAYLSWPCYTFWEEYVDPADKNKGIIDYPWMYEADKSHWKVLPPSTFWPRGPGLYELQYEESTLFIDLYMWSGGDNWYFDYYCFADNTGKMLSEHLEVILVKDELPENWKTVVSEKMGRKGYDADNRLLNRMLDLKWECPADITYPDPNVQ